MSKRDEPRLALATSGAAAFGLAGVVVVDLVGSRLLHPPDLGVYGLVALLIALAGVGPWLARPSRGRTVVVRCEEGLVHAGALTLRAGDVTALHVAAAARGQSVAIARGRSVVFLEVERADEAQRIAASLNVPIAPMGAVVRPSSRAFAVVQLLVTVVTIVFAALYLAATQRPWTVGPEYDEWPAKALFGVGGVVAAGIGFALLVARRVLPGHALTLGRGAWDAHVALQRRQADEAVRTEEGRLALPEAEEEARSEPIRVANLGRGDEPIGAWLARLDAIPSESHAYRGDALKKDVLWDMLGDDGAPVDARMAAARVLQRRYGAAEEALVRVVEDREVRVRVEAALEEHDDAEEHLERLGPLFRAR